MNCYELLRLVTNLERYEIYIFTSQTRVLVWQYKSELARFSNYLVDAKKRAGNFSIPAQFNYFVSFEKLFD